jgi:threonylcarbamoyladenosine tRNA methylthiotransferase MtaB
MRRRYLRELYADRVATIKKLMPHCCIGVDIITGFPGETQEDFLETFYFLNELEVSYLHVFTYSERANTHAITLKEIVPQQVREERTTQLINLSLKKKRYFYQQHIGSARNVLWEAEQNGEMMFGFTDNYIKVKTQYDPLLVNTVTPAVLVEADAACDAVLAYIIDHAETLHEKNFITLNA